MDAVTVSDVDDFRLAKVREGALSATSINKLLTTLAAILETAVEYELIARNPAKGRKRRLPTVNPHRSWLDRADHITALLDAAREIDSEGRAGAGLRRPLIATLLFAGLRERDRVSSSSARARVGRSAPRISAYGCSRARCSERTQNSKRGTGNRCPLASRLILCAGRLRRCCSRSASRRRT